MAHKTHSLLTQSLLGLALVLGVPQSALALSLGEIRVTSQLGEPFLAEVALQLRQGERAKEVRVAIGTPDDYAVLELHRPNLLYLLDASVVEDERGPRIVLRSARPIQEPFFNVLLQTTIGVGSHYRNFPVFLDIPQLGVTRPAPAAKLVRAEPKPVEAAPPPVAKPEPAKPPLARRAAPVEARGGGRPAVATPTMGTRYGPVKRGETLNAIALQVAAGSGLRSTQVMAGIWDRNRARFVRGNINGLLAGVTLDIPTLEELQAFAPAEAEQLRREHQRAWAAGERVETGVRAEAKLARTTPSPVAEPLPVAPRKPAKPEPQPAMPAHAAGVTHEMRMTVGDANGKFKQPAGGRPDEKPATEQPPAPPESAAAVPPTPPAPTAAVPPTAAAPPIPSAPVQGPDATSSEAELALQLSKNVEQMKAVEEQLKVAQEKLAKSEAEQKKLKVQAALLQQEAASQAEAQRAEAAAQDEMLQYGLLGGGGLLLAGLGAMFLRRRGGGATGGLKLTKPMPAAKGVAAASPAPAPVMASPAKRGGLFGFLKREQAAASASAGGWTRFLKKPAAEPVAAAPEGAAQGMPAAVAEGLAAAGVAAGVAVAATAAYAAGGVSATDHDEMDDLSATGFLEEALGLGLGGEGVEESLSGSGGLEAEAVEEPSFDAVPAAGDAGLEDLGSALGLEELGAAEPGVDAGGSEAAAGLLGIEDFGLGSLSGGEEAEASGAEEEVNAYDTESTLMLPPGELDLSMLGELDLGGLRDELLGGDEEGQPAPVDDGEEREGESLGGLDLSNLTFDDLSASLDGSSFGEESPAAEEEELRGMMSLEEDPGTQELNLGDLAAELGFAVDAAAPVEESPGALQLSDGGEEGFDLAGLSADLGDLSGVGDEVESMSAMALDEEGSDMLDLATLGGLAEEAPPPADEGMRGALSLDEALGGEDFDLSTLTDLGLELPAEEEEAVPELEEASGGEVDLEFEAALAGLGGDEDGVQWGLSEPGPVTREEPEPTADPNWGAGLALSAPGEEFDLSGGQLEVAELDLSGLDLEAVAVDFEDPATAPAKTPAPSWQDKGLEFELEDGPKG